MKVSDLIISTWSYENRVSKHFVILRNFPCLIAWHMFTVLFAYVCFFFFFACFVAGDLCRSGCRQNYYLIGMWPRGWTAVLLACVAWRFWLLSNKGGWGQKNREEIGAGAKSKFWMKLHLHRWWENGLVFKIAGTKIHENFLASKYDIKQHSDVT